MILKTRVTNQITKTGKIRNEMIFQHEICGDTESLVSNGKETYWADGVDGTTLIDAKFAKGKSSPFKQTAPSFITDKVRKSQVAEFSRVREIVASTDFDSFVVVVNSVDMIDFFGQVVNEVDQDFHITVVVED